MLLHVGNVFVTTLNFCYIKGLRSISPEAMRFTRISLNMRHAYDGSIQQKGTRYAHERRHETDTPTMLLCSSCSSRFRDAGPKWGWTEQFRPLAALKALTEAKRELFWSLPEETLNLHCPVWVMMVKGGGICLEGHQLSQACSASHPLAPNGPCGTRHMKTLFLFCS